MEFDKYDYSDNWFGLSRMYFYANILNYSSNIEGFRAFIEKERRRIHKNKGEQTVKIPVIEKIGDDTCDNHILSITYEEVFLKPGQYLTSEWIDDIKGIKKQVIWGTCYGADSMTNETWNKDHFKRWFKEANKIKKKYDDLEEFRHFLNEKI